VQILRDINSGGFGQNVYISFTLDSFQGIPPVVGIRAAMKRSANRREALSTFTGREPGELPVAHDREMVIHEGIADRGAALSPLLDVKRPCGRCCRNGTYGCD
jgi:hypothetical protein